MKTIDVRLLVRDDVEPEVALRQLVAGVLRIHGAAELVTDGTHPHEPWPQVSTRPNVVWSGEEITRE